MRVKRTRGIGKEMVKEKENEMKRNGGGDIRWSKERREKEKRGT